MAAFDRSMMQRRGVLRLAASVAAVGAGVGTRARSEVTAPAAEPAAGDIPVRAGDHVVLLAWRHDDPALARGMTKVVAEVARQLRQAGLRASLLDEASDKTLRDAADEALGGIVDRVTGKPDTARAARALAYMADEVCSQADCRFVIEAKLILQRAPIAGDLAAWDGVTRPMPVSVSGGKPHGFRGEVTGLSVALIGVAATGRVVFSGIGGVTLPFDVNTIASTARLRPDLLESPAEIAEGVRVALRPLIERIEKAKSR